MTDPNVPEIVPAAASEFGTRALMEHWRRQREQLPAVVSGSMRAIEASDTLAITVSETVKSVGVPQGELGLAGLAPEAVVSLPEILVGAALIEKGGKTDEGDIVVAVTPVFRRFLKELARDPNALYQLNPRQLEELIAGAYEEAGCERVVLTPRSGDKGRDVIATSKAFGTIRIIDQVKLYRPDRVVKASHVRELYCVFERDESVSKAIVTTTSRFAPGVYKEFASAIPNRLSLRDGKELRNWLHEFEEF